MVGLLVAAVAAPLASTAAPPPEGNASTDERRPLVLLVHGRGHAGLDTADLRRNWLGALNAGASAVAGRPLFQDGDVSLVWYADALDPLSSERCTRAQLARYRRVAPADDGMGAVLGLAGMFLAGVVHDAAGEGARELRNIAGDLQYFGDVERRCASEQRLARALTAAERAGRPVILVAHSLGAIVSWSHLRTRADHGAVPSPAIRRLVTIGSPLGSREVRQLLFGPAAMPLDLPAGVREWINVVDTDDPLAVPLGTTHDRVRDVRTGQPTGGDPHHITRYLRDAAGAQAIVGGWCDAFVRRRPAACSRVATGS